MQVSALPASRRDFVVTVVVVVREKMANAAEIFDDASGDVAVGDLDSAVGEVPAVRAA